MQYNRLIGGKIEPISISADRTDAQSRSLPVLLLALHATFARTCTKFAPIPAYKPFRQRCATATPGDLADWSARQQLLDEVGMRHLRSGGELAYLFSGAHIIEACLDRLCLLCPAADDALGALLLCPELVTSAFELGEPVGLVAASPAAATLKRQTSAQSAPDVDGISNVPTLTPVEEATSSTSSGSSSLTQQAPASSSGANASGLPSIDGVDVEEDRKKAILAKMAERQRRFMRLTSGEDARPAPEAAAAAALASTSPKPTTSTSAAEQPSDAADEDALRCTCVVCNLTTCVDPTRAAEGEQGDPSDPLGLVALVQQGGVHLHRPASLPRRSATSSRSPTTRLRRTRRRSSRGTS